MFQIGYLSLQTSVILKISESIVTYSKRQSDLENIFEQGRHKLQREEIVFCFRKCKNCLYSFSLQIKYEGPVRLLSINF